MLVYRVANLKYKQFTLSGIGAEKVGGRWNQIGTRAVYCSENIALALLEYYIHSDGIAYLPKEILVAEIYVPPAFEFVALDQLPEGWDQYPYSSETSKVFTEIVTNGDFGLKVPSSIIGLEHNFILNPLHKNFGQVEIVDYHTLPVDERLRKATK